MCNCVILYEVLRNLPSLHAYINCAQCETDWKDCIQDTLHLLIYQINDSDKHYDYSCDYCLKRKPSLQMESQTPNHKVPGRMQNARSFGHIYQVNWVKWPSLKLTGSDRAAWDPSVDFWGSILHRISPTASPVCLIDQDQRQAMHQITA